MTPDERIDQMEAAFAELSLKLDRLLACHEQILKVFTRIEVSAGKTAKETASLLSSSNGFREEVFLGKTYKTIPSKRVNSSPSFRNA